MEEILSKEFVIVFVVLFLNGSAAGLRRQRGSESSLGDCTSRTTEKTLRSGLPDGELIFNLKKDFIFMGTMTHFSIIEYKYNDNDFDVNDGNTNLSFGCDNRGYTDERRFICIRKDSGKIEIREGSHFASVPNTTEIYIKVKVETLSNISERCSFLFIVGFRPTVSPATTASTSTETTTRATTTSVGGSTARTKTKRIETTAAQTTSTTSTKPKTSTKIKRTTIDPCAAANLLRSRLQVCYPNYSELRGNNLGSDFTFVYPLRTFHDNKIWKVAYVLLQNQHGILKKSDRLKVSLYAVGKTMIPEVRLVQQVQVLLGEERTHVRIDAFLPREASSVIIKLHRKGKEAFVDPHLIKVYISTYEFCSNSSCLVLYDNWTKNFSKGRCASKGNSDPVSHYEACFAMCPSEATFVPSSNSTYSWPVTLGDSIATLPCTNFNGNVTRRCSKLPNKHSKWGPINMKSCMTVGQRRSEDLGKLSKGKINAQNASLASQKVKNLTAEEPKSLRAAELDQVTNILEELAVFAANEKVANAILDTVDNCMEAPGSQLLAGQNQKNVSKRMLTVLSTVCGVMLKNKTNFTMAKRGFALAGAQESKSSFQGVSLTYEAPKKNNSTGVLSMKRGSGNTIRDPDAAIHLPQHLLSSLKREKSELIFIAYEHGKLFQERNMSRLNSRVISAEVRNSSISGLLDPVVTQFRMNNRTDLNDTVCVWWDFNYFGGQGGWSTAGCRLHGTEKGKAICYCDHLTNFAVLLGAKTPKENTANQIALTLISYIGVGISLAGSLFTLISYVIFPKLRDNSQPPKILMNLCSALIFLQIVFLVGIEKTSPREGCQAVAFLLQYILLCVLSWSGVEGFFSYRGIVFPMKSEVQDPMFKAAMFGWVVPLLFPIIGISVWAGEYGDDRSCAVKGMPLYTTLIAPVGVVLMLNVFSIVSIVLALNKSSKAYPHNAINAIHRLRIIAAFALLFSLTWLFGFFVVANDIVAFQYIFCILNSLQGFFVFVFYGVRNENVRKSWRDKFRTYRERKATTSTSAGTKRTESSFDSVTYNKTDSLRSDSIRKNGSLDSQFKVHLTARSNLYSPPP